MTRGIETMLNLPHLDDLLKGEGMLQHAPAAPEDTQDLDAKLAQALALAEQAEKKLALVNGTDHAESMDALYDEIRKHAQDLMDLGFNIDHARARGIFEVASSMFKNAIDAKNSKRDAELKAMRLALDEKKLELERLRVHHETGLGAAGGGIIAEAVVVEDRNELIKRLRAQIKQDKEG